MTEYSNSFGDLEFERGFPVRRLVQSMEAALFIREGISDDRNLEKFVLDFLTLLMAGCITLDLMNFIVVFL